MLRQTVIASRLGAAANLSEHERASAFYVSLLAWVGCVADSHELSRWFDDDTRISAGPDDEWDSTTFVRGGLEVPPGSRFSADCSASEEPVRLAKDEVVSRVAMYAIFIVRSLILA